MGYRIGTWEEGYVYLNGRLLARLWNEVVVIPGPGGGGGTPDGSGGTPEQISTGPGGVADALTGEAIGKPVMLEGGSQPETQLRHRFSYYHLDHLGTPQVVTSEGRTVRWSSGYYPFGSLYDEEVSEDNEFRFPGQIHDRETDLYYNWHRYYQPRDGRYISADPLGLGAGDVNLYRYGNGNPIVLADPAGTSPFHPSMAQTESEPEVENSDADCDEPKCGRSWGWCYTRCIETLAPGFDEFFIGSQILSNAPYVVEPVILSPEKVIFVEKAHIIKELLPRTWSFAAKVSKIVRPIQAVAFSWVAGASYGCMLSCALDPCSY